MRKEKGQRPPAAHPLSESDSAALSRRFTRASREWCSTRTITTSQVLSFPSPASTTMSLQVGREFLPLVSSSRTGDQFVSQKDQPSRTLRGGWVPGMGTKRMSYVKQLRSGCSSTSGVSRPREQGQVALKRMEHLTRAQGSLGDSPVGGISGLDTISNDGVE